MADHDFDLAFDFHHEFTAEERAALSDSGKTPDEELLDRFRKRLEQLYVGNSPLQQQNVFTVLQRSRISPIAVYVLCLNHAPTPRDLRLDNDLKLLEQTIGILRTAAQQLCASAAVKLPLQPPPVAEGDRRNVGQNGPAASPEELRILMKEALAKPLEPRATRPFAGSDSNESRDPIWTHPVHPAAALDLFQHLHEIADKIQRPVDQLKRKEGAPRKDRERQFMIAWAKLAKKESGKYLDVIGAKLMGLVFGQSIEADTYKTLRIRALRALKPKPQK